MFKQKWAAIVYGRSYHLDFRFITVPEDFSTQDINWAAKYILATTRKARKLDSNPRWSLFKNDSHCVVGVTCMVKDLIGKLGENSIEVMARDDRGRPLYVFVGYVAQLDKKMHLLDLPPYTEDRLDNFKSLYRYVEQVWLVKNYEKFSKQPIFSSYSTLNFAPELLHSSFNLELLGQLNYPQRNPDKIFLWHNSPQLNRQLWSTSALFPQPTSLCLGLNSKPDGDSPFLNQTVTELTEFTIQEGITTKLSSPDSARTDIPSKGCTQLDSQSLWSSMTNKAKEDLDLTRQHAAQVLNSAQELIDNWQGKEENQSSKDSRTIKSANNQDFGFKPKTTTNNASNKQTPDWF